MATNNNTYSVPAALAEAKQCLVDAMSEYTWAMQHNGTPGEVSDAAADVRHWRAEVAKLEAAAAAGVHVAKRS